MNTLVTIYQSVPPFVWAFLFGTPFIVGLVNLIKRVFGVNSTLVVHVVTVTVSFLLANLPTLLNNPKPFGFLGAYTTAFFTAANILYAVTKKFAPFWASVQAYELRKANLKAAETAPAVADVSTGVIATANSPVTAIPVEYEG